jgi:predicted nucleic acid-binding protein
MTLVVDASIAAKWFVDEGREQALRVLDRGDRQAPDLIVAEVANVLWQKVLRGQVTESQAHVACGALPHYFDSLHASEILVDSAMSMGLAIRHPVYDCFYLACAERSGGALVTADRRLLAALAGSRFAALAMHVGTLEA